MKRPRFLICRIDRVGDVVLSTPLPREIKNSYPESFIAVLVRNYTKDIFINNPYVDEIIIYDENKNYSSFLNQVKTLRKIKFEYAFMLLPNERLNYILFLAGIKTRIGVGRKLYQFLTFTKFVDRKKYIPLRHEADYNLDMLRKIGIEPQSLEPEIHLSYDEKKKAQEFRDKIIGNKKFLIGINVTSGNSSPNLSVTEYKRLFEKLKVFEEIQVISTDLFPPKEIQDLNHIHFPMIGSKLRESIVKFSALDLLISSSTGPMHVCSALKVPTISLFCPLPACSPKLWGPLGNKSLLILPEKSYCETKCPGDPKLCNFFGEGGINAEKIINEVINFLKLDSLNR